MTDKQAHWIRIQYDPDFDHFLTDGAYSFTRGEINITSAEARKKVIMFIDAMLHEIEVLKRQERLNKKE